MKKQTIQNESGFVMVHGLLAVIIVAVISFIGGSVFTAQQKMKDARSNASITNEAETASELKTIKKESAEDQKPIVAPAEQKKVEPAPAPAPVPVPAPAPAPMKKTHPQQPIKKEPGLVPIAASAQVGAEAVVLTASLPAVYSGTCKALVKHMDGSNHKWLEVGFSSSNACSITVPRSTLTTASEWQYYLYFNSSDWTVKGDSGKHTFVL